MDLPFSLETALERRIAADSSWRAGVEWGAPRSGHPEGAVKWHVAKVLANLDQLDLSEPDRTRLRLAALVHDSFKREVDRSAPRVPPNEHGFLAGRWLASHVSDERLIALVELHDEGYRAWRAHQAGRDEQASGRITQIIRRMGDEIGLFVAFYWADNRSGDKTPGQVEWFVARLADCGVTAEVPAAGQRPNDRLWRTGLRSAAAPARVRVFPTPMSSAWSSCQRTGPARHTNRPRPGVPGAGFVGHVRTR